jgi:Leucine-rich repeat (LRR) protein
VKDLRSLQGLTNLSSLYLSKNQIEDPMPVTMMPRLSSLYLDQNRIKSAEGLEKLRGLFTLSLNQNQIADVKPLSNLAGLYNLFLEENNIRDLSPLVEWVTKDKEQRFAPFLNLYLKGNPLNSTAKKKQLAAMKGVGVRIHL